MKTYDLQKLIDSLSIAELNDQDLYFDGRPGKEFPSMIGPISHANISHELSLVSLGDTIREI